MGKPKTETMLPLLPHADSPLCGTKLPETLEDVSIQMDNLAHDGSDIAINHLEADRLLIRTLRLLSSEQAESMHFMARAQISEIIANYNLIRKWYE